MIGPRVQKWLSGYLEAEGYAGGREISPAQLARLARLKEMVLSAGLNLTAIRDPDAFDVKHIMDSMTLLPLVAPGLRVADLGAGAGFPGLVLAIMRPDLDISLIEAKKKKAAFIAAAAAGLGLANARAVPARSEDMAGAGFGAVAARAVADLGRLCRLAFPIMARGGTLLAMKGPGAADEIERALPALRRLGGSVEYVKRADLGGEASRCIVGIRKSAGPQ